MDLLRRLSEIGAGVRATINPLDGGKTYGDVIKPRKPLQALPRRVPLNLTDLPTQRVGGGVTGLRPGATVESYRQPFPYRNTSSIPYYNPSPGNRFKKEYMLTLPYDVTSLRQPMQELREIY